jgi:hypothetical protein
MGRQGADETEIEKQCYIKVVKCLGFGMRPLERARWEDGQVVERKLAVIFAADVASTAA